MKFKRQGPELKFYWNRAKLIHLCIMYGCFPITKAKSNCCNRDHTASKPKIFMAPGSLQKKLDNSRSIE